MKIFYCGFESEIGQQVQLCHNYVSLIIALPSAALWGSQHCQDDESIHNSSRFKQINIFKP